MLHTASGVLFQGRRQLASQRSAPDCLENTEPVTVGLVIERTMRPTVLFHAQVESVVAEHGKLAAQRLYELGRVGPHLVVLGNRAALCLVASVPVLRVQALRVP